MTSTICGGGGPCFSFSDFFELQENSEKLTNKKNRYLNINEGFM
jgi:hypothetical protein